jgi:raffinose/stachyose/melibiose transport system substrate-binding protein
MLLVLVVVSVGVFATGQGEAASSGTGSGSAVSGKLTLLSWYNEKVFGPVLSGFKAAYPNVTVDFQNVPSENNQYGQRLNLLANSGELPDVFYIQPPVTLMAKNGYLADLSALPAVTALPATFRDFYSYGGKAFAFCPDAWVGGLFYNKDLFAANGIKEFSSWNDFLAASKIFLSKGIKPISMAGNEVQDLVYWLHIVNVLSKNPTFNTDLNTGKTKFSDGYLGPFTTWYNDCVQTGIITKDMVAISDEQRMDEFATGKAAMTISGPWAISTFKQKNPQLNLGIMPFVGAGGEKYSIGALNVGIAISAKAKNPAAAQAFLNYMGSKQGLAVYQGVTGNFLGATGVDYKVDPVMETMKQYASTGNFAFPPVNWTYQPVIDPMVGKGLQEIILGTTTPAQLAKDIDAKLAELIQQ